MLRCNCSKVEDYERQGQVLTNKFLEKGFPDTLLKDAYQKHIAPQSLRSKEDTHGYRRKIEKIKIVLDLLQVIQVVTGQTQKDYTDNLQSLENSTIGLKISSVITHCSFVHF